MILCCLQEKNGTGDHHVNWDKPSSERQVSHFFTHMWAESRPKIIIMGHECKRGTVWDGQGKEVGK
jgi:hypothetical protein